MKVMKVPTMTTMTMTTATIVKVIVTLTMTRRTPIVKRHDRMILCLELEQKGDLSAHFHKFKLVVKGKDKCNKSNKQQKKQQPEEYESCPN